MKRQADMNAEQLKMRQARQKMQKLRQQQFSSNL